jgi:hypothetical protein
MDMVSPPLSIEVRRAVDFGGGLARENADPFLGFVLRRARVRKTGVES